MSVDRQLHPPDGVRTVRRVLWPFLGAISFVCALLMVAFVVADRQSFPKAAIWPDAIGIALAVGFVFSGVAVLRVALRIGTDGVRLRTPFSSETYKWGEIKSFRLEPWSILKRMCVMHLRDGRRRAIWAAPGVDPMWRAHDQWAEHLIDELNSHLATPPEG